jgi:hypothetical protein
MLAKRERDLAAKGKGCLGKAADDEPVFVLRANDVVAPAAVEAWADFVEQSVGAMVSGDQTRAKVQEARSIAHQMRAWQALNGSKFPD